MFKLSDPFAPRVVERRGAPYWLVVLLASALGAGAVGAGAWYFGAAKDGASVVEVRPTPTILTAVKDIARLEVTEVQVEKVVDLTDRQKVAFGLLDAEDAMLLVASGSATIGVDLEKLGQDDATFDERTGTARLRLPQPEVFASRLDPDNTYVYRRETSLLAQRNERLEGRARKEATMAVEKAASEPEVIERARAQAERQLTALLTKLGAKRVEITWERQSPV
jgi:hypothetical protein